MKFNVKVLAYGEAFGNIAELAPCRTLKISELGSTTAPVATVSPDDPAAIFFTGGTEAVEKITSIILQQKIGLIRKDSVFSCNTRDVFL